MKAIKENKNTYKITGELGDFFVTEDNNGKIKMFAKKNVTVIDINEMPKVKVFKSSKSYVSQYEINAIAARFTEAEKAEHKF